MIPESLLDLIFHGNQLKRIPRTGWVMRGVPNAESVAGHTYGVAYIVLALFPYISQTLDEEIHLDRALSLAVIHDLPESITTDIPQPAWKKMPKGVKGEIEQDAMDHILKNQTADHPFHTLWEEAHTKQSAEARLVKDADRLDLYVQVLQYERQFGNRTLSEFWEKKPDFYYELCQTLYQRVKTMRDSEMCHK